MKLLLVIVLYREQAVQSLTVRSLQNALAEAPDLATDLGFYLYDNSPEPFPIPAGLLPKPVHVCQPRANRGLAVAYNAALDIAMRDGAEWLVLLDSDTELTRTF